MKRINTLLLVLLLVAGLSLFACRQEPEVPAPTPVAEEAVAEPEAEPTAIPTATAEPEPTEPPEPTATPEPQAAGPEQLTAAFSTFLAGMDHYNIIGLEDANVALVEDPAPFLLDVRRVEEAEENGHIPGAILIPLRELGQNLDKLPSFDTPLIVYCAGGWRATIAATALEALGWEDARILKDGSFGGWAEAGYPVEAGVPPEADVLDAAEPDPAMVKAIDEMLAGIPDGYGTIQADALNTELIENPDLILIDVRTAAEIEEKGYIDAAGEPVMIPIEEFVAMQEMWPEDPAAEIVVYCGSGHRSTIGMTILQSYGYENVRSLVGGFGGWAEAGFPVAGGSSLLDNAFATFLDEMEGYGVIGLEDANLAMVEAPAPFILDVREPGELEAAGHIPGAVHIPLRELAQNVDKLPAFDTPIIVYCAGGWRATIGMTALEAMGWQDVKTLKGGSFGGWVEAGYAVEEGFPPEAETLDAAAPDPALVAEIDAMLSNLPEGWGTIAADTLNTELIENPDLILIDVRRAEELADNGVIDAPNLIHIPLEQFVGEKDLWPAGTGAEIVVYCGSGHRSTIAMGILRTYGYENVRSLVGGFGGWAEAGYPTAEAELETGAPAGGEANLDEAFATFLEEMEAYGTISLEDTNLALVEDPPPFILDVREPGELEESGHIPGAVHIPLRELAQNIEYLPAQDVEIIVYCAGGWRATIALTALEAMGWEDVKALKGGSFGGWVDAGYEVAEGFPPEPMRLDVAEPAPALVAAMDQMLGNLPEGWGTVSVDALNTELIENPDLILIDVRRDEEVAEQGVVDAPNLIHIPLEQFVAGQEMWPEDPAGEIVVYCGSGHRSTIAMSILRSYDYENVRSLVGGFGAWAEAGYPVMEMAAP